MFIFVQLLPRLITLEFQVIALKWTAPFLQNLVASPVRHAELKHETIDIKQLIGNDSDA